MNIKKSCDNCADFIVCLQSTGKEPTKVCSDWQIDFLTYQEIFKEATKGITDLKEISKLAKNITFR